MRKFLLILLFLALIAVFCQDVEAQQFLNVQYLPHIVAGSLPASEWDTVIEPKCLSSAPCSMTIEFFDSVGIPLLLDTDKGMSNRFDIVVSPAVPGPGSFPIQIRRNQSFVSGWARITSSSTFSGIGKFRQFVPGGAELVGVASVFFSASDLVLTFDLKPSNGVALVNPNTADATVTVTALAGGREITEVFQLPKGHHMANFFKESPFSFGDLTGNVVISSNVPLVGIELGFEGLGFFTLPSLPTIRKLDAKKANIKIGTVYVCVEIDLDRPCQKPEDIALRVGEAFTFLERILRREIGLNGAMQNIPELPIDKDEHGLPKVISVSLKIPRGEYISKDINGRSGIIWREINPHLPLDWTYQIIWVDDWKVENGGKVTGRGWAFGGGSNFSGSAWLGAEWIPFLRQSLLGNMNLLGGVPIPEFGGRPFPTEPSPNLTWDWAASNGFELMFHETGHVFELGHSSLDPTTEDSKKLVSIMSGKVCLGVNKECILTPIDAHKLARSSIFNIHDYGWVKMDEFGPFFEIISIERTSEKIRATIRIGDIGSGVHSVWFGSNFEPWTLAWRMLGHDDDLNKYTIEAKMPKNLTEGRVPTQIFLSVLDYHGNHHGVQLF